MYFTIENIKKTQIKKITNGIIRNPICWSINNEVLFNQIDSTNDFMYLEIGEELIITINNKNFLITSYNIHFDIGLSSEFNDVSLYHDGVFKQSFYNDTMITNTIYGDNVTNVKIVNNCFDKIKIYFDTGLNYHILKNSNISTSFEINTNTDITSIKIDNKVKSSSLFNDSVYTSIRQDKRNVYYNQNIVIKKEEYDRLLLLFDYSKKYKSLIKCSNIANDGYDNAFFGENFGSEDNLINYSLINFKMNTNTGLFYHCTLTLRKEDNDQYI